MLQRKNRVIIDTNLWISFILTGKFSKLDKILNDGSIVLLFSTELLDEFIEVARRPKFRKYFPEEDLIKLLHQIEKNAEFIDVEFEVNKCRDPKDNFLLSVAHDGRATHLISGDKDLTSIEKFGDTVILSLARSAKK